MQYSANADQKKSEVDGEPDKLQRRFSVNANVNDGKVKKKILHRCEAITLNKIRHIWHLQPLVEWR